MKNKINYLVIFLVIFTFNIFTKADPFNSLKKITLGPDDQVDGATDSNNNLLVFTRKANLVSSIQILNFQSLEIKNLYTQDGDTTQAKFNTEGQILFTSFKNNSKGDICFSKRSIEWSQLPLDDRSFECVPRLNANAISISRTQAIWKSNNEIIFIEQFEYLGSSTSSIKLYNTNSKSFIEIYQTKNAIVSPSAVPNGKYLIFTEVENKKSKLLFCNLQEPNFELKKIEIHLPGQIGIVNLSEDENYIYFSQFMSDTNQDGIIDGKDNGVIWRVSLEKIIGSLNQSFPTFQESYSLEHLTPINYNCSYPFATKRKLYLSCAFGGSLDIYELPQTGVVPIEWDENTLKNAFESARSYQERILILNTLKMKATSPELKNELNFKLLQLHILSDEVDASEFYLNDLKKYGTNIYSSSDLKSIEIYLKAKKIQKKWNRNIITFEVREEIKLLKGELESAGILLRSYINCLEGKKINIYELGKQINSPLDAVIFMNIAEMSYERDKKYLSSWSHIFEVMLTQKYITPESRLYYANEYLLLLDEVTSIDERKILISNLITKISLKLELLDSNTLVLFKNELHIIDLIVVKDAKLKMIEMQKIDHLLMANKANYFLRKVMNIRCILNFSEFQELQKLNIVSANWIRDTPRSSTEFSYAKEIVIKAALEQGYGFLIKKNRRLAADYFFQSLSLTDDLESHSMYAETMLLLNQIQNFKERISYLDSRGVISNGQQWIKVITTLQEGDGDIPNLEKALSQLSELRVDLQDPLIFLLKGFIHLAKIERAQLLNKKFEIHDGEAKAAHRNLVLASDLSQENPRVKAAALMNLGLLHLRLKNYGQSVRFFGLRKNLGFYDQEKSEEYKAFVWYYAESLYYFNQPQKASQLIKTLGLTQLSIEFLERFGFYSIIAKNWDEAQEAYEQIERIAGVNFVNLNEPTRTKVLFSKAVLLFNLNRKSDSQNIFSLVLNLLPHSPDKEFIRETQNLVYGYLSQLGNVKEQQQALENRIKLLENDLPNLIQSEVRLADLQTNSNSNSIIASQTLQLALKHCIEFAEENGTFSPTVTKTLNNYLVHGILNKNIYSKFNSDSLSKIVLQTLTGYQKQLDSANIYSLKEHWRLKYLWIIYQNKVLNNNIVDVNNINNELVNIELEKQDPNGLKDLKINYNWLLDV